jgi:GH43 family beta-xylosidase
MDSKMSFAGHIDVTFEKALAILGFVNRLLCEFRDPYTLKTLYVSLVRPKLEYASCVWRPFYGAHIDRIERVQKNFVRYALRGLGWTDMCDLPPYVERCALIRLETLAER